MKDPVCKGCGDAYTVRSECQDTGYCDLCAQTLVEDALRRLDTAKADMDKTLQVLGRTAAERDRFKDAVAQWQLASTEAFKVLRKFIERVESGEIRSRATYEAAKHAIETAYAALGKDMPV